MKPTMKLTVDTGKCVGAGQCVLRLPEVFDQSDEDGLVVLLQEQPAPEVEEDARLAVLGCPSGAIEIVED